MSLSDCHTLASDQIVFAKNRQKLLKNTQITIQCCKLSILQCTCSLQFKLCSIYFARYFQNPLTRSIITHQNQKIPNFFSIYSEWSRDSVLEKWRVGEQPLMDTTTSTSRLSEAQQQQSVAASAGSTYIQCSKIIANNIQVYFFCLIKI